METGKTYIIRINIDGERLFTYTGKIISEDELFVTFIDKNKKILSYNKTKILSFEECEEVAEDD